MFLIINPSSVTKSRPKIQSSNNLSSILIQFCPTTSLKFTSLFVVLLRVEEIFKKESSELRISFLFSELSQKFSTNLQTS